MSQSYGTVSATSGSTGTPVDPSAIDEDDDAENPSTDTSKAVGAGGSGIAPELQNDDDDDDSDAPSDVQLSEEERSSNNSWKVTWKGEEEEINFLWPRNHHHHHQGSSGPYDGSFEKARGIPITSNANANSNHHHHNNNHHNHNHSKESSMLLSLENLSFRDGTCKPLKIWYRNLVIRQACHSHMAEDYIARDMFFNTISVAMTALSSCVIFVSLVVVVPAAAGASASASTSAGAHPHAGAGTGTGVPMIGPYNALALIAGVLAACNTVLQAILKTKAYHRRGENHRSAFKHYTKMRFRMENLIGDRRSCYHHNEIDETMLDAWIEKYEELLETEPIVPQDILEWVSEKEDSAGLDWTRYTMDFD